MANGKEWTPAVTDPGDKRKELRTPNTKLFGEKTILRMSSLSASPCWFIFRQRFVTFFRVLSDTVDGFGMFFEHVDGCPTVGMFSVVRARSGSGRVGK